MEMLNPHHVSCMSISCFRKPRPLQRKAFEIENELLAEGQWTKSMIHIAPLLFLGCLTPRWSQSVGKTGLWSYDGIGPCFPCHFWIWTNCADGSHGRCNALNANSATFSWVRSGPAEQSNIKPSIISTATHSVVSQHEIKIVSIYVLNTHSLTHCNSFISAVISNKNTC